MEGAIAKLIASFITAELPPDRTLTLAHGIVGMAESTCRHWLRARAAGTTNTTAEELADQLAELAWTGSKRAIAATHSLAALSAAAHSLAALAPFGRVFWSAFGRLPFNGGRASSPFAA